MNDNTITLVTKFSPLVDERFATESKTSLVVNRDFDFIGTKSIKIYSVATAEMNDYGRNATMGTGTGEVLSRYGTIKDLSNTTQEVTMEKDRSFTFVIDKMDEDETLGALNAGSALARQLREVIIPEVDKYTFEKMADNAGETVVETITDNPDAGRGEVGAYESILAGTEYFDEKYVPTEGRVASVVPAFYTHLKKDQNAVLETEIGQNMRIRGVVSNMDGVVIQKVPSTLMPTGINFILSHRVATTQAIKLAEYKVHNNVPFVSGSLVEGRIYYTAFVRNNKKDALYVSTTVEPTVSL